MSDGWTVNDDYTAGYDKALAELKPEIDRLRAELEKWNSGLLIHIGEDGVMDAQAEIDRLRAENAEMREALQGILEQWTWDAVAKARAILAKKASAPLESGQERQKSS